MPLSEAIATYVHDGDTIAIEGFTAFIFFSFPLIIFDLRHQFLNFNNFVKLFSNQPVVSNKLTSFFAAFYQLNQFVFHRQISLFISNLLLIVMIIVFLVILFMKNHPIKPYFFFFLLMLAGISLYSGDKFLHYYGFIYPVYFILIAYFLALLDLKYIGNLLIGIFLLLYIFFNYQQFAYLFRPRINQINLAKKVAQVIYANVDAKKYTVTALPQKYSDSPYRYFLEIWGKRPIEKDSLEKADVLFVVCDSACDLIIGNPQWDIAYFAPKKIDKDWRVDDVKIFKLTR